MTGVAMGSVRHHSRDRLAPPGLYS